MTSSSEFADEAGTEMCNNNNQEIIATDAMDVTSDSHCDDVNTEMLNSDDDAEEGGENAEEATDKPSSVTNWKEPSTFVDKTKCAFEFNNSVIFDLDE